MGKKEAHDSQPLLRHSTDRHCRILILQVQNEPIFYESMYYRGQYERHLFWTKDGLSATSENAVVLTVISQMLNNSAVYREPLRTCMQLLSMLQKQVTSKDDAQVTMYTAQAGWMDIVNVPSPASLISWTASHAVSQLQKNAASEATHTHQHHQKTTARDLSDSMLGATP